MSSVVQNLLDNVLGDGARSSKFECSILFKTPELFPNFQDVEMLVKTSQFPGKRHETIDLRYKGRTIPIKGQTKYDNVWTCTFYLTQDHKLKKAFEDWIESIDQKHNLEASLPSNVVKSQMNNVSGYTTTMYIKQMDLHGTQDTAVYELMNVFPKSVQQIDVDYSNVGSILEFTVEFSYSHYNLLSDKVNTGTYVDSVKKTAQTDINNAVDKFKKDTSAVIKNKFKDLKIGKIKISDMKSNFFG